MENKKRYNPNVETNINPFIGKKDPLKYLELTLSCRIPIRLDDEVDMDEVFVFDEDGKGNGKVTPKMYNLLSEKFATLGVFNLPSGRQQLDNKQIRLDIEQSKMIETYEDCEITLISSRDDETLMGMNVRPKHFKNEKGTK